MGFQKKLRNMQDNLRNAGWRIEWIPWWEDDKPEVIVTKNPLALIGVLIFLGAIFLGGRVFGDWWSEWHLIGFAVAGLAITMLGIIFSAYEKQAGWVQIEARCIDWEIAELEREPGDLTSSWDFRVLCEFSYKGKKYTVTPEASHLSSFSSERKAEKYLDERIDLKGNCWLWVDPKNPLHTVFDKKKWWL